MTELHIDIETYSSVDIKTAGAYKYAESLDFEILMIAYAFDSGEIQIVDLARGEQMPSDLLEAFADPDVLLFAHNATFERICLRAVGYDIPIGQWRCSAIKAGFCGLPLSLGDISTALKLGGAAKDTKGAALIRFFCVPVKPTKRNGMRERNLPEHDPEKWEAFLNYCIQDVAAEMAVLDRLKKYEISDYEQRLYALDQKINDRGIKIDLQMASNAQDIDAIYSDELMTDLKRLTGAENPGSPAQLKEWLSNEMQKEIKTLSKDTIPELIKEAGAGSPAAQVLSLRLKGAKTSVKKYTAMLACCCEDGRGHGLLQFYGAGRTGRWAGRIVQLQNLPQNHIHLLDIAREAVASGDYQLLRMLYDDVSSILSQLIRTAFVCEEGSTFAVADFSAIEARVIAWLADEEWRLEVFASHGKIYEASASMMFAVPIEEITKGSPLRQKGKVAELALGYQGAVGALKTMGAEEMGLTEEEMLEIKDNWRAASPAIVALWADLDRCAIRAIKTLRAQVSAFKGIIFDCDGKVMTIELPSGRKLYYQQPLIIKNKWGRDAVAYMGQDSQTKKWKRLDTYGGKLTENIVQAISRDLLAVSMMRLDAKGFDIVLHVHDEAVAEILDDDQSEAKLEEMCQIMGEPVSWAPGLILTADGYLTKYYKKD